ncbi:hypothetical protein SLEP1_g36367 [Rubroshorea leprosula]|uniref:Phytocyanin domain-containing protein n=1 Tax=Rubroshorea leprosula TaxID=152421 RepID=A0AAV5KRH1_9ROSI|nr:hypothetical protein SLEP1_g36367 [Rubroshorea leprosula]
MNYFSTKKSIIIMDFFCAYFLILAAMNVVTEASKEFKVGNDLGWQQPTAANTSTYTDWAARKRFHVGDSLTFVYQNDSVLEVDKWGYYHCNTETPISAFNDGNTVIELDRPGPFYFISRSQEHCKNGQRLEVLVMGQHHSWDSPPLMAAPPEADMAPRAHLSSGLVVTVTISLVFLPLISTILILLA